jgi:hypothetical protein
MSHAESLEVLARLHVDLGFREAFLRDAGAALRPFGLSERERAALSGIEREVVERLGRLADHHRVARVREQLRWFDLERRPGLGAAVGRYMREVTPRLLNRDEAIAFCAHVEAGGAAAPPYLPELARYERKRISLAWGLVEGGSRRLVERFAYPVLRILEELERPGWPEVEPEETRVEMKKVPRVPAVLVRAG